MSQADLTLNCAVSGTVFTNNLNSALSAVDSMHSGALAPALGVVDGKAWLDTSSGVYKVKLYRTVWHPLFELTTSSTKLTVDEATTTSNVSVGGALAVTGDISSTSDRRVKDNLHSIEDSVTKLNSLAGYTYNRLDLESARQAGLIAQEVEAVLPEAVITREDGIKSLNYNAVVALLVEAVKESHRKLAELEEALKNVQAKQ